MFFNRGIEFDIVIIHSFNFFCSKKDQKYIQDLLYFLYDLSNRYLSLNMKIIWKCYFAYPIQDVQKNQC